MSSIPARNDPRRNHATFNRPPSQRSAPSPVYRLCSLSESARRRASHRQAARLIPVFLFSDPCSANRAADPPAPRATTPGILPGTGTGGLINVSVPVQVCGIGIGAVSVGSCPSTGAFAKTGGADPAAVATGVAAQGCGVSVGAVGASATGACPAAGPTVAPGTGGGLTDVGVSALVCGVAVGALGGTSTRSCPQVAATPASTVPATTARPQRRRHPMRRWAPRPLRRRPIPARRCPVA